MRKVRMVLAVLFIIFLFVGCDFSDPSDSKLVSLVMTDTSLATIPLAPAFAPSTLAYSAGTPSPVVYFNVVLPKGATATYNGTMTTAMNTGATNDVKTMTIAVTSKDGSTTTQYVITVTRTL
jgi:hypothetical protein